MNQDLEKVVEEENEGILLCETWGTNGVRSLLYQIISAVDFIHSAGVAHRNLYPAAILLNGKSAQVGSFSQAISTNTLESRSNLPKYIPGDKRFAAPELWVQRYDSIPANLWKCIDMWAIGCLMAYVLRGAPLFELIPGNEGNEWLAQVYSITECRPSVCGAVSEIPHLSISEYFTFTCAEEKDLLSKLLCFDPHNRLTTKQALSHAYFDPIRQERNTLHALPPPPERCVDDNIFPFFRSLTSL